MNIEYDEQKVSKNLKKHGVSFEEAEEALYDPFALVMDDKEAIDEECFCYLVKAKRSVF